MASLKLPARGLGCASLGKTVVDGDEAHGTILAALEGGISYLDTAPLYGCGLSERRVGHALRHWNGRPPKLSTKVGYVIDAPEGSYLPASERRTDYSRDAVRRSLELSLRRMDVGRVDLVYIHAPDGLPDEAEVAFHALSELQGEGLLDAIGVGTTSVETVLEVMRRCPIDAALVAGRLTLLNRGAEVGLLDSCADSGVAVVAGGIFNSGILAAADPAAACYDYAPATDRLVAATRELAAACSHFDVPLKVAAIRFVDRHRSVTTTLLGAANRLELAECLSGLETSVPELLWADLDKVAKNYAL